jgi:hypothetical protein
MDIGRARLCTSRQKSVPEPHIIFGDADPVLHGNASPVEQIAAGFSDSHTGPSCILGVHQLQRRWSIAGNENG